MLIQDTMLHGMTAMPGGLCLPCRLLICLGMVLPRVAATWSLCSSGIFAARYSMHDISITAGIWKFVRVGLKHAPLQSVDDWFQEEGSMGPQLWACLIECLWCDCHTRAMVPPALSKK